MMTLWQMIMTALKNKKKSHTVLSTLLYRQRLHLFFSYKLFFPEILNLFEYEIRILWADIKTQDDKNQNFKNKIK